MNSPTHPIFARMLRLCTSAAMAASLALGATGAALGQTAQGTPVDASAAPPPTAAQDVKFVEANGIRFAYIEQGRGPLVLLLHGYPETARSWRQVQQRLATAGYRVVAPFMRGYAPSGSPQDKDYTVPTLGRDVIALIDALGAERAVVVGHDWGAVAAHAAQAQDPSRLSALVAMSLPQLGVILKHPELLLIGSHFLYYQLPWAERLVADDDFAHIDRLYRKWAPSYSVPAEVLKDIKDTLRLPGGTTNALAYYKAVPGAVDLKAVVDAASHKIDTPSLVIAGAEDLVKPSHFESVRSSFTGRYEFVQLEGVGHFPQLEAPDRLADAILAFIATTP